MTNDNKELNELLESPTAARRNYKSAAQNPVYDDDELAEARELGNLVQWTTGDNRRFVPASNTRQNLVPGVYEIQHSNAVGLYFEKISVKTEGLLRFPQTNSEKVVKEIQNFWEKENIFREYKLTYKRGIILWGPAGCHAAGAEILMFDGTVKKVEDVQIGDNLMGPDSKPRRVLELRRGRDYMYKITPVKGNPFIVNGHHVLSLKRTDDKVMNLTVNDFISLSNCSQKSLKLWRTDVEIGLSRKKGLPNKDPMRTGIRNIEPLGEGDYYGFTLSDDHLYLTSDYMVHHNSGKSSTIQLIMKDVVERNGIVIKFTNPGLFLEGMRVFREIEKKTPVVILMEDIDSTLEMYNESEVLNILDGVDRVEKLVFLATTNYPERLGARIINRPSRFDKRFKIDHPNAESRMMYFKYLIGEEKIKELKINLDKWVKDTDKFSIAHLKELFVAVVILGDNYKEAVETLSSMKESINSSNDRKFIGFGGDREA